MEGCPLTTDKHQQITVHFSLDMPGKKLMICTG